jgi:glycosyltransferase involved in cell wall biosynthesis
MLDGAARAKRRREAPANAHRVRRAIVRHEGRVARRGSRRPKYDVAFYAPWIAPLVSSGTDALPGGAETQILFLARGLAAKGCRVCILARPGAGGLPSEVHGIDLLPLPTTRQRRRFDFGLSVMLYGLRVVRSLAGLDARVLVQRVAGPETGVTALVTRMKRQRFIYSSAGVKEFDYGSLESLRRNVWLFHLGVRLAHAVVVQTDEQVGLCRQRFGRAPVLIKSVAEPAATRSSDPAFFLWVGRLAEYKRPEAFVEVARRVPEARFAMIGVPVPGSDEGIPDRVRREAAQLDNLELLEPRPRAELMRVLDGAVAIVSTTPSEGMPNVFLEAWARGVPALSLAHDPDGVIERHSLGGFARGSLERMAAIVRKMWHERANQREVSARCRSYIEREHAPDAVIGGWLGLIGGDPAPPSEMLDTSAER